jgi:Flp pilus assembly protein TadG
VDFGCAYVKAAQIQTAADAAVLAAGRLLPVSAGDTAGKQRVLNTAEEYLRKMGSATRTIIGSPWASCRAAGTSACM